MNKIFQKRNFGKHYSSPQIIAVSFLIIIIIGALLLMLPISTRSGQITSFTDCFFTATSATCVTGLVTFDTFTYWSYFGQTVIIVLIQIGGLGFMTVAALFSIIIRKNLSLKEKMTMVHSFNIDREGIQSLIKRIVFGTFFTEAAGGIILAVRFSFDYPLPMAIYKGFFTSISAFCNAGFDVFGDKGAFSSLASYSSDYTVIFTVAALIIIGGLGFFVWIDIFSKKRFKRYSLFSKTVIILTAVLLVFGAVSFFILENGNAETAGNTMKDNILQSIFFSSTLRTAGYSTFNFGALKETTLLIAIFMMFIGGDSGSTAGGIKVSTLALLLFSSRSALRGRNEVYIGKKRISYGTVIQAIGLVFILFSITAFFGIIISEIENLPLLPSLFEAFSAIGTVGLTTGITTSLSACSLWLLIILMFLGRVGIITIMFALNLKRQNRDGIIQYPEVKFNIG